MCCLLLIMTKSDDIKILVRDLQKQREVLEKKEKKLESRSSELKKLLEKSSKMTVAEAKKNLLEKLLEAYGARTVPIYWGAPDVTEVFTGFGQRGVTAEKVASRLAGKVREYLEAGDRLDDFLHVKFQCQIVNSIST